MNYHTMYGGERLIICIHSICKVELLGGDILFNDKYVQIIQ